jgi:hypothetical protein
MIAINIIGQSHIGLHPLLHGFGHIKQPFKKPIEIIFKNIVISFI